MSTLEKNMISIAEDFSRVPGGRYPKDGPFSGELFRIKYVEPALRQAIDNGGKVTILLDGTAGYATSFLEETFGGLVRYFKRKVSPFLEIITENPVRKREVEGYINDEESKL